MAGSRIQWKDRSDECAVHGAARLSNACNSARQRLRTSERRRRGSIFRDGDGERARKPFQVRVPAAGKVFLQISQVKKDRLTGEARIEAKDNLRIGAVILAAGTCSGMGKAKQLFRLGVTILRDQVVENVRGSQVDEIVIVRGHQAETIKERIAIQSLHVVINESYRQGMGTSLRTGLSAAYVGIRSRQSDGGQGSGMPARE